MGDSKREMSWGSFKLRVRIFVYLDRQIEDEERWEKVGNSRREMNRESLRLGARVFVYLDRQIKGKEK